MSYKDERRVSQLITDPRIPPASTQLKKLNIEQLEIVYNHYRQICDRNNQNFARLYQRLVISVKEINWKHSEYSIRTIRHIVKNIMKCDQFKGIFDLKGTNRKPNVVECELPSVSSGRVNMLRSEAAKLKSKAKKIRKQLTKEQKMFQLLVDGEMKPVQIARKTSLPLWKVYSKRSKIGNASSGLKKQIKSLDRQITALASLDIQLKSRGH